MDDIWIMSWFNYTAFDANPIWKSLNLIPKRVATVPCDKISYSQDLREMCHMEIFFAICWAILDLVARICADVLSICPKLA